jgi:hypothetical protein
MESAQTHQFVAKQHAVRVDANNDMGDFMKNSGDSGVLPADADGVGFGIGRCQAFG